MVYKCPNFLIFKVNNCTDRFWYMCCLYGVFKFCKRSMVWVEQGLQLDRLDGLYLIIGDFNQVENEWNKLSSNKNQIREAGSFFKWKLDFELIDIPFKGPRFT